MEDLAQKFLLKKPYVKVEWLENETGEVQTGAYFLSIVETVNGVHQIGNDALLIVNDYVMSLI